ncbi:hypothetical protein [Aestuariivirga sp.]|uniref:hypothetical protein n=1 Tax=Aestuariivirga sp. TaxID=2650926 RepID=UPI0039E61050
MGEMDGYRAMYLFLNSKFEQRWENLAELLGSMQLSEDELPFDPAFRDDWKDAVARAKDWTIERQQGG